MNLDQHIQAVVARGGGQFTQPRRLQGRDDQQHGVGAERARLGKLVHIDAEVFAQHRECAGPARGAQMVFVAEKKIPIGEHGQGAGAAALVLRRDLCRGEALANHPPAGRGFFDFRNHRRLPRGHTGTKRGGKSSGRGRTREAALQVGQADPGATLLHFLRLARENTLQHVGDGRHQAGLLARISCVRSTNALSFSAANPAHRRSSAMLTPAAMDAARPAT